MYNTRIREDIELFGIREPSGPHPLYLREPYDQCQNPVGSDRAPDTVALGDENKEGPIDGPFAVVKSNPTTATRTGEKGRGCPTGEGIGLPRGRRDEPLEL